MTTALTLKSLISAPQNRGGYWCRLIKDNPSDRIYHALSWLLAATSAFCWLCTHGMPPTCHLSPLEPHRDLIVTPS